MRRRAGRGDWRSVGRRKRRSTLPGTCRALHVMAPLPLPVGDATDFDMGYSQSEFSVDLCVNVLVRPTRVFRRASQGPQGRVVPFGGAHGKARSSATYCS